ncbi:hypothetical protein D3C78_1556810 [compost metagenome]
MGPTDTPARHHLLERRAILRPLHGSDEVLHLGGLEVEDEVRVAAEYAGIQGQGVQPRLVAQLFAEHERHVAVGAVAQQAVHLAAPIGQLHPQQRGFR